MSSNEKTEEAPVFVFGSLRDDAHEQSTTTPPTTATSSEEDNNNNSSPPEPQYNFGFTIGTSEDHPRHQNTNTSARRAGRRVVVARDPLRHPTTAATTATRTTTTNASQVKDSDTDSDMPELLGRGGEDEANKDDDDDSSDRSMPGLIEPGEGNSEELSAVDTEDNNNDDEEEEEEEDDDDDDDDDDDNCSCSNCVARRRRAEHDSDEEDDEDEDDDWYDQDEDYEDEDEEDEDFEDILFGRMMGQMAQHMMGRRGMRGMVMTNFEDFLMEMAHDHFHEHHHDNDNDYDSDETDDDMPPLLGENDEVVANDKEDESFHDENAPTCAICLEHESRKRPLVTLPCCGLHNDRETESTTRFCDTCLTKYMKRDGAPQHAAWRNALIGECPRCKHLLVKEKGSRGDDSLHKAGWKQIIWYAGLKDHGAYPFVLIVSAWCHRNNIPQEVFTVAQVPMDKVEHLVRWGLLIKSQNRKNEDFYYMEEDAQDVLRSWSEKFLTVDSDGDISRISDVENLARNRGKLMLFTVCQLACCVIEAGRKWKIRPCVQFISQIIILLLIAGNMLPSFHEWTHKKWDERLVTGLIIFMVCLLFRALIYLFKVCIFVGMGWVAAKMVGLWMQSLPDTAPKWKRYARPGSLCVVGVYILVRVFFFWKAWFPREQVEIVESPTFQTLLDQTLETQEFFDLTCSEE